jgi:hypothetical protein
LSSRFSSFTPVWTRSTSMDTPTGFLALRTVHSPDSPDSFFTAFGLGGAQYSCT